ncbi:alkaline phosphatase D family protein [Cellvibrio sp. PSBB006]|uniref:alkaline phosphatase D family protein n=1 Tax=Cellvibrio sp. PSBB006 TaxID=1987723 RepID=UPI000B3B8F01|nr:alkaline phosphatase D family protein [Cellvibrio sp. PSBB006]ARU26072.1 metallophosphatase [Cellvibrio sp. PSBB006]
MKNKLVLGPILGLESDSLYTVTFVTNSSVEKAWVKFGDDKVPASSLGGIRSGSVWRAELKIEAGADSKNISYNVLTDEIEVTDSSGRSCWSFYVPGKSEKPKMAYVSCNGFSDYKLMNATEQPYRLWEQMKSEHAESAFSLLLMGGDQVYADSIWTQINSLKLWNELPRAEKIKRSATKDMRAQIDKFYSELYVSRWNKEPLATMLASIPSIMMWDDHDIFDGWGSYPDEMQSCEVYQAIFAAAKKHYELLQVRGRNTSLLAKDKENPEHYSSAVTFRGYTILSLDNRSDRRLTEVMSQDHWLDITGFLENKCPKGDLLVLSAVPVVYRDFSFAESAVDATPWEEALEDDLKDHWRAKEHEGERLKLIMNLLTNAHKRKGKTVMLSGDVHVGCLGIIQDKRKEHPVNIHQVVSSGIVHPAPTYLEWLGILAITNDDLEYLDETRSITADMIKPHGSNKYIRARNFVTLLEGTDKKLWVNWVCEGKDKPAYPLQSSGRQP